MISGREQRERCESLGMGENRGLGNRPTEGRPTTSAFSIPVTSRISTSSQAVSCIVNGIGEPAACPWLRKSQARAGQSWAS